MTEVRRPGSNASAKTSATDVLDVALDALEKVSKHTVCWTRSLGHALAKQCEAFVAEIGANAERKLQEAHQREIEAQVIALKRGVQRRAELTKCGSELAKAEAELKFWRTISDSPSVGQTREAIGQSGELMSLLGITSPQTSYQPLSGAIQPANRNRIQIIDAIVTWSQERYVEADDVFRHWRPILHERGWDHQQAEFLIQQAVEDAYLELDDDTD